VLCSAVLCSSVALSFSGGFVSNTPPYPTLTLARDCPPPARHYWLFYRHSNVCTRLSTQSYNHLILHELIWHNSLHSLLFHHKETFSSLLPRARHALHYCILCLLQHSFSPLDLCISFDARAVCAHHQSLLSRRCSRSQIDQIALTATAPAPSR
jgi:hypothetical protein